MKQVEKSIQVHATAARIFDYLTQPTNLLEIWPSMTEVTNVTRSADGNHSFDWVYKMAGIHFNGHSDSVRVVSGQSIETHTTKGIKNTFRWKFESHDDATAVTLQVEYELPIPLLGKLAESFLVKANEREAETLLHNLKARLEASPSKVAGTTLREKHA
jgi:uncharacterized membrane protein